MSTPDLHTSDTYLAGIVHTTLNNMPDHGKEQQAAQVIADLRAKGYTILPTAKLAELEQQD